MNKSGFTLMEIMVSIVIMSALALFAIPSYTKSVQKQQERVVIQNLLAIHAAAETFKAYNNGTYHSTGGLWRAIGVDGANGINAVFNLNIVENDFTYSYLSDGKIFFASSTGDFNIVIQNGPIDMSGSNLYCTTPDKCPSLGK